MDIYKFKDFFENVLPHAEFSKGTFFRSNPKFEIGFINSNDYHIKLDLQAHHCHFVVKNSHGKLRLYGFKDERMKDRIDYDDTVDTEERFMDFILKFCNEHKTIFD